MVKKMVTLALALSLWAGSAHAGKRSGHVRMGDVGLSFTAHTGLIVSYRGERLVGKSTVVFHDGKWKQVYHTLRSRVTDVIVTAPPPSVTDHAAVE